MSRVVADTNVFISALMFGGLPEKFLDMAFAGRFHLATSPVLLDELEEKLLLKFEVTGQKVAVIRSRFELAFEIVSAVLSLSVIKNDPDDDRVLECAVAARADYIISGDRHLLSLGSYEEIQVITVRQFMDRFTPSA